VNGSTPNSEQLKEELEKLRLAKEVLAAERELELEAQRVTGERQAEAQAYARAVALQDAEEERIAQEHARNVAAQQQDLKRAQLQKEYRKHADRCFNVCGGWGALVGLILGAGGGLLVWSPSLNINGILLLAFIGAGVGFGTGGLLGQSFARSSFKKRP
jgi:Flp pilus assembly protein TadB